MTTTCLADGCTVTANDDGFCTVHSIDKWWKESRPDGEWCDFCRGWHADLGIQCEFTPAELAVVFQNVVLPDLRRLFELVRRLEWEPVRIGYKRDVNGLLYYHLICQHCGHNHLGGMLGIYDCDWWERLWRVCRETRPHRHQYCKRCGERWVTGHGPDDGEEG